MDREALYARIDARVEAMVAAGAVDEVRAAHRAGASATARPALGFEELLAGDVAACSAARATTPNASCTWLRRLEGVDARRRHRPRGR